MSCWGGRVDVKRIWQPEPNRISLRWQFHGIPRIPWEVQGVFDGVSQFKLDRSACLCEGPPSCVHSPSAVRGLCMFCACRNHAHADLSCGCSGVCSDGKVYEHMVTNVVLRCPPPPPPPTHTHTHTLNCRQCRPPVQWHMCPCTLRGVLT